MVWFLVRKSLTLPLAAPKERSHWMASKELCDQLLKERDDNEKEFLDVLNNNKKLKCEMAQLHTQHTEAIEARDRLQFVVDGFSQCSIEYEQTLHSKALLEHQLHEANNQISHLEMINHNITASLNNSSLQRIGVSPCSQSQHIDLNPLTIDLTGEKRFRLLNQLNIYSSRLNKNNRKYETDTNNLQLELDHLTAKLHTMTNKYSASEKQMREHVGDG
ncbi:hypothetical protein SFRURICE_015156 [Spodoptera frugiperda]|nr:hypothetical protein SFRURICE_015156 [Spodoptera frugiperda]